MRCMVECTKINVLQLFCWPMGHDPLPSLGYLMITYTHPAAGDLPIKTLVAKQQPTNNVVSATDHDGSFVFVLMAFL